MFGGQKTGEGVNQWVEQELDLRGLSLVEAFTCASGVMLSSGPDRTYLSKIQRDRGTAKVENNTVRAEYQAAAFEATRVGDIEGGKIVFEGDAIYNHFYNDVFPDPKDMGKSYDEVYKVEAETSRNFVRNIDGHVFTAVCGASKERIFYREETPEMMENIADLIARLMAGKGVRSINGIPAEIFHRLYKPTDYDAVYRLICLSELDLLLKYAHHYNSQSAYRDYLFRKEFYMLERKDTYLKTQEATRYKVTDGSWHEIKKHDRPIYNLSKRQRFERRCKAIAAWTASRSQPVITSSEYKTPAFRPSSGDPSPRLKVVGLA